MHRFKKRCAYKIHYRIQQRARGDPRKNHGIGMGLQYANLHSVSLVTKSHAAVKKELCLHIPTKYFEIL